MNVETLKYFQYIAKYKNITQAAKHLYISQSTLSRHIMTLENELGVKLFERNNKMIILTDAGKTLYNNCDALINHMDYIVKDVIAAGKGHSGTLKVTAPRCLLHTISDALALSRKQFPDIKYFVESYEFNEIPLAVKYGFYDIGITYDFALPEYEELEHIALETENFFLAFPSQYQEEDDSATLKRLVTSLPFIIPSHTDPPYLQDILTALQNTVDAAIHSIVEINTSESLLLNISLGLGYGLLPESLLNLLSEDNTVSTITPPAVQSQSKIVALCKKEHRSELTTTFYNLLKKEF